MSGAVKQRVTAEELWEMPEVPGVAGLELVDGEVVEVPGTGGIHGLYVKPIVMLLDSYARARSLGLVYGDNVSYVLQRDPDTLRIPDVHFYLTAPNS